MGKSSTTMQTTPSNSASLWQPWRLPAAVACNLGALYTMQGLLRPLFLRALTALGVYAGGMEIAQQAWISVVYFVCYALVYRLLLPDAPQYTSAPIQRRFLLPFAGILLGLAVCGQLVSSILVVLCGQWGLMLQGVSMADVYKRQSHGHPTRRRPLPPRPPPSHWPPTRHTHRQILRWFP